MRQLFSELGKDKTRYDCTYTNRSPDPLVHAAVVNIIPVRQLLGPS